MQSSTKRWGPPFGRYSRQMVLQEVGKLGQEAFSRARVLCVGAGGLGSPALLYLAAAGVGTVGIIDADQVDVTNLQRQIIFNEATVGKNKAQSAREQILAQNQEIRCDAYPFQLNAGNSREILSQYDLALDCTDNFSAKFLINDTCAALDIPWVYASINRWEGQIACFFASKGPCYRCLYPEAPRTRVQNCAESGVIGAAVGILGSWQALYALQILLPGINTKWGHLRIINALSSEEWNVQIEKNPRCPTCSISADRIELRDLKTDACETRSELLADELLANEQGYLPLDVRSIEEWTAGHLPGARHWPLSELERGNIPHDLISEVKAQKKMILVYCLSGTRSRRAAALLAQSGYGYKDVFELKGGVSAWPSKLVCPQRA